jgi:hypothetical protein
VSILGLLFRVFGDAVDEPVEHVGGVARPVSAFFDDGSEDRFLGGRERRKRDGCVLAAEFGTNLLDSNDAVVHPVVRLPAVDRALPVGQRRVVIAGLLTLSGSLAFRLFGRATRRRSAETTANRENGGETGDERATVHTGRTRRSLLIVRKAEITV